MSHSAVSASGAPYVLDYHDLDHPGRPVFVASTLEGERYDTAPLKQVAPGGEIEWLWPGMIPLRRVTLIEGPAGAGKSQLALDLAARVSRSAAWPNGETSSLPVADVLVVCRRDEAEIVSARFERAGGDRKRLFQFREFETHLPDADRRGSRPIALPYDFVALEQLVEENAFGVIIIDSLADFCATPKLFEETLELLEDLAARANAALLVTVPANCRIDGQGRLRATSRWPTDSVRSAWCLVRDPDDPWRWMFVAKRTNYCREPDGLAFRLTDGGVAWEATSRINPVDPLGQWSASELFVQETLKAGDLPASTVFRLGAELGFTPKVLRAASKRLGVTSTRIGLSGNGHWSWSLPGVQTDGGEDEQRGNEECTGTYGEFTGNRCLVDASGDGHVEQVSNLLVAPTATPASRAVQEGSESRMGRLGTNDGGGEQDAGVAERGNEECMGTFGNLCRIPGETPIAAAEVVGTGVAVADSREPSGWERDHAEARRLRRKARRQRKKERRQARSHAG